MVNPLTRCVQDYSLPPYAHLRPDDIAPALRTAMEELASDLEAIEDDLASPDADISWESVMDRLEIIDDPLDRLWGTVSLLISVANAPELRAAHADLQMDVVALQSKRAQSIVVYQAMLKLRQSSTYAAFTSEQKRILNRAIQQATLRGVNLVDNAKERFNEILVRLKTLSTTHGNNELDGTKAYSLVVHDESQLDGVPKTTLSLLAQNAVAAGFAGATPNAGPWKLSLELPVYAPLMKSCANRAIREQLFVANNVKAKTNEDVVVEMVQLRHELATLLGFASFAELNLVDKTAPSADAVLDTLHDLKHTAFPHATAELRQLEQFAASHNHPLPLEPWDIAYWTEQLRKDKYELDDDLVRQYFPLPKVLSGVFDLVATLFQVRIEAADGLEETWHPDVRFFQMRAMDTLGEPVVAQFYLDPYARPGQKRQGSFLEVVVSRSKVLRTAKAPARLPVFAIVLNQAPPVGETPSLMTFADFDMLLGCLGLGLRVALTSAEYTAASGMDGIEMDAAGIPVWVMQRFCYHRDSIKNMSGHFETNEPLPHNLFDKLVASKRFMSATKLLRQLFLAGLDLTLHHQVTTPVTVEATNGALERVSEQFVAVPRLKEHDYTLCHFRHIFSGSLAAGYFTLLWAEVQAHDAYASFEESQDDPTAWRATGLRYRDTILALSGAVHPTDAFALFRGRKHRSDAMLAHYGLT